MLPVTHGVKYTAYHIMLYTLVLIASTLLPFATGLCGPLYLVGATILGLMFLYWSIQIMLEKPNAPMSTFKFSILYLMMLYMIMLADHYLFPIVKFVEVTL